MTTEKLSRLNRIARELNDLDENLKVFAEPGNYPSIDRCLLHYCNEEETRQILKITQNALARKRNALWTEFQAS